MGDPSQQEFDHKRIETVIASGAKKLCGQKGKGRLADSGTPWTAGQRDALLFYTFGIVKKR